MDVEDLVGDLGDQGRPRMRADYVEEGPHTNRRGERPSHRALVARTAPSAASGLRTRPGLSMS